MHGFAKKGLFLENEKEEFYNYLTKLKSDSGNES
jgi:hypothetical protein